VIKVNRPTLNEGRIMNPASARPYRGVFPVAPTIFDDRGELDLDGQRRCIDFMIDAGSNGICILANFSEQFVLTDAERERVMDAVLKHVAGRVPVIVTTTHFSSSICAARSRQAQDAGAAMVMIMPPYHGATFRVGEKAIFEFYRTVSDAIEIPIMVQDAPVAGTPLSVDFLARMARDIAHLGYFKIEVPMAAAKLRDLITSGMPDLRSTVELGPSFDFHLFRSENRRVKLDLRMPVAAARSCRRLQRGTRPKINCSLLRPVS